MDVCFCGTLLLWSVAPEDTLVRREIEVVIMGMSFLHRPATESALSRANITVDRWQIGKRPRSRWAPSNRSSQTRTL
jgi:hypothetical protein